MRNKLSVIVHNTALEPQMVIDLTSEDFSTLIGRGWVRVYVPGDTPVNQDQLKSCKFIGGSVVLETRGVDVLGVGVVSLVVLDPRENLWLLEPTELPWHDLLGTVRNNESDADQQDAPLGR